MDVSLRYIRLRISPLGLLMGHYRGLGPLCESQIAQALAGIHPDLQHKKIVHTLN